MNLRFVAISIFCMCSAVALAQTQIAFSAAAESAGNGLIIKKNDVNGIELSVNIDAINLIDAETKKGDFCDLSIQGAYTTGAIGEPQLPAFRKLIKIPHNTKFTTVVDCTDTAVYNLNELGFDKKIQPHQPSQSKSKSHIVYKHKKRSYHRNYFTEQQLFTIIKIGTMRNVDLYQVAVNPIRYNPKQNIIQIFNNINIDIKFANDASKSNDAAISGISSSAKSELGLFNSLTKYPVKYLIVTHSDFLDALTDFINWKRLKGYDVVVATTDEIGSSVANIKSWITEQYNNSSEENPAPSFLLLAADTDKIPCSQTGEDSGKGTDLYYACMDGDGDILPDMYYGRFSARTAAQMKAIVDKTVAYEKFQFADSSFLAKATLIAGYDASYRASTGIPTLNYIINNRINADNGYSIVNSFTTSYKNCYDTSSVAVGLINYSAHGTTTSWVNPELTQSAVRNFSNQGKYPFVIANCCYSGNIVTTECLGETWLRQADAGAVAYIGSSPQTWWHEDSYWAVGAHEFQSKVTPTLDECGLGAFDVPFVTDFLCGDGVLFAGNLAVAEAHDNSYKSNVSTRYYWEAYNYLGDPSLLVYFGTPTDNVVSYEAVMPIGSSSVYVEALVGSYVAISKDSVLLGAAIVDEGESSVNISVPAINDVGQLDVVVTKNQCKPHFGKIELVEPSKPYITLAEAYTNIASNDTTLSLNVVLRNMSQQPTQNARIIDIATSSKYVKNIVPINYNLGVMNYQLRDTVVACSIELHRNIPDQTQIPLTITVCDVDTFLLKTKIKINAPRVEFQPDITVVDNAGGSNLMPGGSAKLGVSITNNGHAELISPTLMLTLSENKAFISVSNTTCAIDKLAIGQSATCYFEVSADRNTDMMTDFTFSVAICDGALNYCDTMNYTSIVGTLYELQVGNGTSTPSDYPFNNYYKCSKTDVLYTTTDFGANPLKIKSISFDISQATPNSQNFAGYKNFTITAKQYSDSKLSAFIDMTDADTLYFSDIVKLPTAKGLVTFDFDKSYDYDGQNNFVLEFTWGQNDDYVASSARTKVYSHTTANNTVAYGIKDSWENFGLTNCAKVRPNTIFGYLPYSKLLIFNVKSTDGNPIPNANIALCGEDVVTDSTGVANYLYCNKLYGTDCQISATSYFSRSLKLTTTNDTTFVEVELTPLSICYLSLNIIDLLSGNLVDGAVVTVGQFADTTNSSGLTVFKLLESNYQVNITSSGYVSTSRNISLHSDTTITIKMQHNPSLTIRTTCDNQPIANAVIIFENDTLITDTSGCLTVKYIPTGTYNFTIQHSDYAYVNQTITIADVDVDTTFVLKELPNVTFTIYVDNKLTNNVSVNLDEQTQVTDSNGVATFKHVRNGQHNFTINGNLIPTTEGSITTILSDVNIIKRLEKQRSTLIFKVKRNGNPIVNAKTIVYGQILRTDSTGYSMFKQLVPVDELSYIISDDSTFTVTNTIAVDRDTVLVDFDVATMLVNIMFNIVDTTNLPIQAEVEFNNSTIVTDTNGVAEFYNIFKSASLRYIVKAEGYSDIEDILVCDTTKLLTVVLHKIVISDDTIPQDTNRLKTTEIDNIQIITKVYPNPTKGAFNVECGFPFNSIEIIDKKGSLILHNEFESAITSANIDANLRAGVYIILIKGEGRVVAQKIIVY